MNAVLMVRTEPESEPEPAHSTHKLHIFVSIRDIQPRIRLSMGQCLCYCVYLIVYLAPLFFVANHTLFGSGVGSPLVGCSTGQHWWWLNNPNGVWKTKERLRVESCRRRGGKEERKTRSEECARERSSSVNKKNARRMRCFLFHTDHLSTNSIVP